MNTVTAPRRRPIIAAASMLLAVLGTFAMAAFLPTPATVFSGENLAMAADTSATPLLVHNVYFTLNKSTSEGRAKLVAACQQYLTGHAGTVHFSCGTRTADLTRPVNDQEFDVGLHIVFASRKDHDTYQTHPRHLQFIEENRATWKQVRVFDDDAQAQP